MKTFTIYSATSLSASDLRTEQAENGGDAYTVTVYAVYNDYAAAIRQYEGS